MRKYIAIAALLIAASIMAIGCASLSAFGESFNRSMHGVKATMRTYDSNGNMIDQVKGRSFEVSRDKRFDTSDSDGTSKNDSQVLKISLGNNILNHVGSTLVIAQTGLVEVDKAPKVSLENNEPGKPWLNNLRENFGQKWKGRGKTILIRSQDGFPLAVYAGDEVEILSTDVPKSTWFRVDGKYLFVYRADYTVYDNSLLGK